MSGSSFGRSATANPAHTLSPMNYAACRGGKSAVSRTSPLPDDEVAELHLKEHAGRSRELRTGVRTPDHAMQRGEHETRDVRMVVAVVRDGRTDDVDGVVEPLQVACLIEV